MAAAAEHKFRFADPAAAQLAPGERGVRLRIGGGGGSSDGSAGDGTSGTGTSGGGGKQVPVELYAQRCVLCSFSRVMAGMLDSCQEGGEERGAGGDGSSGCADPHLTVPLDGDDPLAWDDALSHIYSLVSGVVMPVAWESAERLLVLADKYDMPGVAAVVISFLRAENESGAARLMQHLTCGNVWRWLLLTSRAGLDDLAELCIADIVLKRLDITSGQLHELHPAVADELLAELAAQQEDLAARLEAVEARAEAAEAKVAVVECTRDSYAATICSQSAEINKLEASIAAAARPVVCACALKCGACDYPRFAKPGGEAAGFCLNCGEKLA